MTEKKQTLSKAEQLKKKHGLKVVYEINVEVDEGDTAVGYLKKPNRNVMGAAMAEYQRNPLKSNEIVMRSCWLDGDERILEDDDIFMSAQAQIEEIIEYKKATIKKH